jgi:hypothetical protein
MSNVINLAEYRRRKEEEDALREDLKALGEIHAMSTEEIALLIQHMFNDEWEEPEPNYSLDSFTYTLSLTTDDDEKEP